MNPLPKEFFCPITQEVMKDPVVGPDGQTYERAAIVDWLQKHHTSPITRSPMNASQLVPNIAVRSAIQDIIQGKSVFSVVGPQQPMEIGPVEEKKASMDVEFVLNSVKLNETSGLVHFSVVPPKEGKRKPAVFICMLDVSGSMEEEASIKTGKESDGFSRLDLVKHSVKTIIEMLNDDDYLSLISFNEAATLILDITKMTPAGKLLAITQLDSLIPVGFTNIWDALRIAMKQAKETPICSSLVTSLLVFTDGEPNHNPPRGIVPTLTQFLEDGDPHYTINMFGYGYQLDSYTLLNMAFVGRGMFSYIPDCSMVGTIFVNYLSNSLATAVKFATLELKTENIKSLKCIGYPMKDNKIVIGAIQYGQSRDFIVEFNFNKGAAFNISAKLKYDEKEIVTAINQFHSTDNKSLYTEYTRCRFSELMLEAVTKKKDGKKYIIQFEDGIKELPECDQDKVRAIMLDIESSDASQGQVTKAFADPTWYEKWGKHYVRSLARAHQLQQCHNFKDPGVQLYGGKLFKELQNKIDTIFCNLPAPKASRIEIQEKKFAHQKYAQPVYVPPPTMHSYLNFSSGCFDGEGLVKLSNGSQKKVKDLQKNDELITSDGFLAKVVCLVIYKIGQELDIVEMNGVKITQWHPVRIGKTWKFPNEICKPQKKFCDYIYNLVLDKTHIVTINNVDLVTLGHGKTENNVVQHPYYGTNQVIEDMMEFNGWREGRIIINKCSTVRDSVTGLVSRIIKA